MGRDAVEASGADDGPGQGVDFGAPERAESVGDFAEDDAGPERAFGTVVGWRHVPVGDEGEELAAPSLGLAEEFGARLGDHRKRDFFPTLRLEA